MTSAADHDAYAILGVARGADDEAINAAFDTRPATPTTGTARVGPGSATGPGGAGQRRDRPSGSVLGFGRHIGWSLGEIARVDPGYLVWLAERRGRRPYIAEIDVMLKLVGFRPEDDDPSPPRSTRRSQR